jgi:hypothetical protein
MDVSIKPTQMSSMSNQYDKIKMIYPNTKIYRSLVPSSKKSWSVNFENYFPVKYTSNEVVYNTNADIDLLNIKYCNLYNCSHLILDSKILKILNKIIFI